jgi:hypothetical protein
MCGNRSWHTYAMHPALPFRNGCDTALQDRLRKGSDDDLSIRSFFLILFNRLLFPTASWGITNHEVLLTEEMDRFHEMDWCQLIFNDLCHAAKKWHTRSVTNVSTTIYGCSIVIMVSISLFCMLYVAVFFYAKFIYT